MHLPVKLKNGERFYVEADETSETPAIVADPDLNLKGTAMGTKSASALAEKHFSEAVRIVEGVAAEITEGLIKKADETKQPDGARRLTEVALEVQLGFDAEGNVYFAKGKASAVLKLNLKWTLPPSSAPGDRPAGG